MKKSKIFMATGALVLAISAVFATKATKKFAEVTTAIAGSNITVVTPGGTKGIFTTVSGTSRLAVTLCTSSGRTLLGSTSSDLVTKSASGHPVYFR